MIDLVHDEMSARRSVGQSARVAPHYYTGSGPIEDRHPAAHSRVAVTIRGANMIVRLRDGILIVTPAEGETLAEWLDAHAGQVFRLSAIKGGSALLQALGPEPEACRIPVNITSQSPEPLRLAPALPRPSALFRPRA